MTTNFLTKEGFKKLQEELDYLRTVKRHEVAERLHEAMEGGELIENAEYEAAKNEQAFVEGRIQELDLLLATAQIIEENGKSKKSDVVQ
ncbi:MAG: transcription elongation factor GreA, partial [Chloroflexi bacterium]|nr:transcription elongation factor GreA [Chloroflexota bacterium]